MCYFLLLDVENGSIPPFVFSCYQLLLLSGLVFLLGLICLYFATFFGPGKPGLYTKHSYTRMQSKPRMSSVKNMVVAFLSVIVFISVGRSQSSSVTYSRKKCLRWHSDFKLMTTMGCSLEKCCYSSLFYYPALRYTVQFSFKHLNENCTEQLKDR